LASSLCEAKEQLPPSSVKGEDPIAATDNTGGGTLLGPPSQLVSLDVGESAGNIVRLSRDPDIFLFKGFLPSERDRAVLIGNGTSNGRMKVAGTNKSEQNTVRKDSYLTWIDPHSLTNGSSNDETDLARSMCRKVRQDFVSDVLREQHQQGRLEYCWTEDLQVAMYRPGGRFDYHHDGHGRFLTVLCYLNGVGGTYFPFASPGERPSSASPNFCDNERMATDIAIATKQPGRDGLLFVGKEGIDAYSLSKSSCRKSSIVDIEAGDALAFYSYSAAGPDGEGERDWKSLHASLAVPEEKYISTCWFRSEALTGPFSWLHRAQLLTA
jgi:hypothetical protein